MANHRRAVVDGKVQCNTCKEWKTLDEYWKKTNSTCGVVGWCIQCSKDMYKTDEELREYRKKYRERPEVEAKRRVYMQTDYYKGVRKEWRDSEKGQELCRKTYLRKSTGMSWDDYKALLKSQDGGCAICGTTNPGIPYR